MSREEAVFQLLVQSNPIPDLEEIDLVETVAPEHLATIGPRSSGVTNLNTHTKTTPQGARRPNWLWAAAAGVIVISIGVILASQQSGELQPAAGASVTPEQVAETFINATEALEAATVDGLITPGAEATYLDIFGYHASEPGSIQGLWEWGAIYDMTYTFDHGCRRSNTVGGPPSGTDRTFFTCDYQLENQWTRALGQSPMSGRFRMEVSEGQIIWLTEDFPFEEFTPAWTAVNEWVQTEHPDDYSTMFIEADPGPALSAKLTPESMALWKEYNPQIVESLTS